MIRLIGSDDMGDSNWTNRWSSFALARNSHEILEIIFGPLPSLPVPRPRSILCVDFLIPVADRIPGLSLILTRCFHPILSIPASWSNRSR